MIDQAESIDYILNLTGHKNLIFMGHSMSVTAQVVLLALRPEYNKKIRGQVLLSPPASFKHPVGFMAYTSKMIRTLPGVMVRLPNCTPSSYQFARNINTEIVCTKIV